MKKVVLLCLLFSTGHDVVWYGMVWYGMVWYGMVWYGMVWYGMVWYGMVWYGMVWKRRQTFDMKNGNSRLGKGIEDLCNGRPSSILPC